MPVEELTSAVSRIGDLLGFPLHEFGWWALRKMATQLVAQNGEAFWAARLLGHRHVNSRTMDRVYVQDLRWFDTGAFAMDREAIKGFELAKSLAARRVPAIGSVGGFADVPVDAPEYAKYFGDAPALEELRANVRRAEAIVAAILDIPYNDATVVLSARREATLREAPEGST